MSKPQELSFEPGLIVDEEFTDYSVMQSSAKNWLFFTKYRFGTGKFYGRHSGVQLNALQFGHAQRDEGMMYQGISPKDCITIALLQKSGGQVCINRLKVDIGDLIIIDDSKPYDFVSSHRTIMSIISIHKSLLAMHIPSILSCIDKKFKDPDNILSKAIDSQWKASIEIPGLLDNAHEIDKMEHTIIETLKQSLEGQKGVSSRLTKGEETAFDIKSYLLESLEETISIHSIAKKFKLSEKTIENSFRSLFGIKPKRFIRFLKLNHAHHDLKLANVQTAQVSDIAIKWGFTHFGRFSSDYKSLFGVVPSITLKQKGTSNNPSYPQR